jgi:hypothetical protein
MGKAAGRVVPGQGKVVVAYLHPDELSVSFHHSLIGMLLWDLQHNGRILGGGGHVAIYQWSDTDNGVGFIAAETFPPDDLVQVAATGAACILIHRSVGERMRAKYGDTWWTPCQVKGEWFSEDMSFCVRLAAIDAPLHVHTGVQTSHHKPHYLTASSYVPPVHLPTVAAIPTKDRWDLLEPLLAQILTELPAERVLVIDDGLPDDDRAALDATGVAVIDSPGDGIHASWNAALDWAAQHGPCHVALLNDDLVLGDGVFAAMERALSGMPDLMVASPNYDQRAGSGVAVVRGICAGRYDGTGGVAGFAMWLAAPLARAYRFPTELTWWYGDNDVVATVEASGGRCGVVCDASVVHIDGGSQTGSWNDPELAAVLDADRRAFEAKWSVSA